MRVQRAPLANSQPERPVDAPREVRDDRDRIRAAEDAAVTLGVDVDVTELSGPRAQVVGYVVRQLMESLHRDGLIDARTALMLFRPEQDGLVGRSVGAAVDASVPAIADALASEERPAPTPEAGGVCVVDISSSGVRGSGTWGLSGAFVVTLGAPATTLVSAGSALDTGLGVARRVVVPLALSVNDAALGARVSMAMSALVHTARTETRS